MLVCVVAFSSPVTRATCDVCSTRCSRTASLDPLKKQYVYVTDSTVCHDSTGRPQLSSLRATSSDGDDRFTVTVLDQQGYNNFSGGGSYYYYSSLSSGGVFDRSTDSTCFEKTFALAAAFSAGTNLYVIIGCTNVRSNCNLMYDVQFTCVAPDPCIGVFCGSHGRCSNGQCVCDPGYTGVGCQTVDACYAISCGFYGRCSNGMCICDPGYTGVECETVDTCYDIVCGVYSTCSNGVCICDPGYSAHEDECKIDTIAKLCFSSTCGYHGTCGSGYCICDAGYSGDTCQNFDDCYDISCGPNSTCVSGLCHVHSSSTFLNTKTIVIACCIGGAIALVLLLVGAVVLFKRRQRQRQQSQLSLVENISLPQPSAPPSFENIPSVQL